jgi:acetyl-CoA carboxylase carboxyltransferase component
MGPKGAVEIIFKNQIEKATDPAAEEERLTREYREKFATPYVAAARGYIDDIIDPQTTRSRLISGLRLLGTKREKNPPKKHGNIPL